MTTVAAVAYKDGRVYIGADSAACLGDAIIPSTTKVFRVAGMVFGFAGRLRLAQLLEFELADMLSERCDLWAEDARESLIKVVVPLIRELTEESGMMIFPYDPESVSLMPGELLIGMSGRLFMVGADFAVVEPRYPYHAIGGGGMVALGALGQTFHMRADCFASVAIDNALRLAARYCEGTCAPFTILHTEPVNDE